MPSLPKSFQLRAGFGVQLSSKLWCVSAELPLLARAPHISQLRGDFGSSGEAVGLSRVLALLAHPPSRAASRTNKGACVKPGLLGKSFPVQIQDKSADYSESVLGGVVTVPLRNGSRRFCCGFAVRREQRPCGAGRGLDLHPTAGEGSSEPCASAPVGLRALPAPAAEPRLEPLLTRGVNLAQGGNLRHKDHFLGCWMLCSHCSPAGLSSCAALWDGESCSHSLCLPKDAPGAGHCSPHCSAAFPAPL